MNELMNDGGDCRTAPATPGLLKNTMVTMKFFFAKKNTFLQ